LEPIAVLTTPNFCAAQFCASVRLLVGIANGFSIGAAIGDVDQLNPVTTTVSAFHSIWTSLI
jgi:hypothetical protein